ncbi:MAG TPA: hypothetical protein VF121_19360 [Thermoanaerobaculia bacterium]|nr:hypothetical protein [Thermoanaerobaculia bacterium]
MKRLASTVVLLCLALAAPAAASTFIHMSPRELIAESAAVVVGEVLTINSFWDASGQIIETEALVRVHEAVIGNSPTVAVVRTFGGTVGGYTIEAHGFPEFRPGERVLLFLSDERGGFARVVGYRLGQYRIGHDRNGAEVAIPTFEADAALVVAPGARSAAPARPYRLDEFKTLLRAEAARTARHAN